MECFFRQNACKQECFVVIVDNVGSANRMPSARPVSPAKSRATPPDHPTSLSSPNSVDIPRSTYERSIRADSVTRHPSPLLSSGSTVDATVLSTKHAGQTELIPSPLGTSKRPSGLAAQLFVVTVTRWPGRRAQPRNYAPAGEMSSLRPGGPPTIPCGGGGGGGGGHTTKERQRSVAFRTAQLPLEGTAVSAILRGPGSPSKSTTQPRVGAARQTPSANSCLVSRTTWDLLTGSAARKGDESQSDATGSGRV